MESYLTGYLDVIPEVERQKVSDVLKQNQELMIASDWSEEEFKFAIDQLVGNHKKLTVVEEQKDILDSTKYNRFFSNMYMDLSLLFAESDLIESGLNSYNRLYDGILSDLQREINLLKQEIASIRLFNESENGAIIKAFNFQTDQTMESPVSGNAHLFLDRDASSVPHVAFERGIDASYVMLNRTTESDRLRNKEGIPTATIRIEDRRGVPIDSPKSSIYGIDKALDNSDETYWGEVILVDDPLKVDFKL